MYACKTERNGVELGFFGNKEFYLSYIDSLRLEYIGDDYISLSQTKLDHSKINGLIFEYLTAFGDDFNGLITAADYWCSIGCFEAAYVAYNKCETFHCLEFEANLIASLKYADVLVTCGQLAAAYVRFHSIFSRAVLNYDDKKQMKKELGGPLKIGYIYEYFLEKFALVCVMLGKKEEASKILATFAENTKHKKGLLIYLFACFYFVLFRLVSFCLVLPILLVF